MAWIESHQSLMSHHKTRKAARLLGVKPVHLIGHLHALWWWALDYADDGDVTRFDAEDIADAAQWDDDAAAFVEALTACGPGDAPGFLERTDDGRLLIHDWWDYAGKLVERRRADAERKRSSRHPEPVQRTSSGHPADGAKSPSVTVTNRNQPTEPTTKQADAAAPRVREDDPLFEVVAEVCYGGGLPYAEFKQRLSSTNRSRINTALKDLKRIGVSVADVRGYASSYRARSPDYPLKPQTIVEGITEHVNKQTQNGHLSHAAHREDPELARQRRIAAAQSAGLIPNRNRAAS